MNEDKNSLVKESKANYHSGLSGLLQIDEDRERSFIQTCKNNDISFLGLFGSYSRREQKKESDIDFLTRFSKRKSLLDHVRIERELSEILGIKVDLVTEKSLSPYLVEKIKSELKTVYHEG